MNIPWIKLCALSVFALPAIATQANENNQNGFYISPKLILAHASLRAGQVKGSYQEPLILYTDQNHDQNDNNTSDIVGGALLSLGYRHNEWRAELSYSYRYRFDLNGNVGEREPGEYERHDNLPGRFRLDINTQAVRFDLYYNILPWQTESLRPFVGVSVESLQHNIHAKVRNRYNYTEEQSDSRSISLGFSVGTEVVLQENINFTVSLHYIDLGGIDIGPQSDNAYFSTDSFDTVDLMFGFNYYF